MRRSVLTFVIALTAMSAGTSSTNAWAQSPNVGSGSSPSQTGGPRFHRPVTHRLGFAWEQPWRVGDMKLVAPGVGWARTNHGLLWTEDGGADWKEIALPISSDLDENLSDIFFLDARRGWAVFSRFDKDESDEEKYEEPKLDVASTTDSGETWTRMHLIFPNAADYGNPDRMPLSGWGGKIAFRDPLHGWINITLAGQTMNTFWAFSMVTLTEEELGAVRQMILGWGMPTCFGSLPAIGG